MGSGTRTVTGAQPSREHRREVDGLQLQPIHPCSLPSNEFGFRRSRLLLWRPVLPTGGAGRGAFIQGVRQSETETDQLGAKRSEGQARRPVSLSRGTKPISSLPGHVGHRATRDRCSRRTVLRRGFLCRHDLHPSRR